MQDNPTDTNFLPCLVNRGQNPSREFSSLLALILQMNAAWGYMGRVRPWGQSESLPGDKYSQSLREGGSLLQQSPALQLSPQRNPRGRARREQVSWIVLEEKRDVSCVDPVHTFPILGNPPSEAVNVPIWRQQEAGSCWCSPSELVQVHSTLTSFPKAGVLPGLPRTLLSSTVGGGGGEGYPLCHSTGAGPAGCYPKRSPSQRMG